MTSPEFAVVADLLSESLSAGRMPYLTVSSGSMRPLLRAGDQVGLQKVAPDQLRAGDVIVVCHNTSLLTHRFCGLHRTNGQTRLLTRGDRVRDYDPLWREEQLLGRAVVRRRHEQLLWLDYGRGEWLNRRLAQMAQVEQRTLGAPQQSDRGRRQAPGERLARAGFHALAIGLARLVESAFE